MTDLPNLEIKDADFPPPKSSFVPPKNSDGSVRERVKRTPILGGKPAGERREKKEVPPSKPGEFVEPVADFYRFAAMMVFPFDPHCASVVIETDDNKDSKHYGKDRAQICAEAWDDVAQKNPQVRKFLRMMTTGGTWGALVAANAPIIMAILSHHTNAAEKLGAMMGQRMASAQS